MELPTAASAVAKDSHPADNVACCVVLHEVLASAIRALALVLDLCALSIHLHGGKLGSSRCTDGRANGLA